MKANIIRCLIDRGVDVVRVPWDYDFNQLEFDGLFLTNGPGDPDMCVAAVENIRKFMDIEEAKAKEVKAPPKEDKKQQEELPQKQETKTIKDLKKLQYIGNMKISVGRGKKSNITEVSEEVVEKKELPKVPEGFLDNIISTTKSAYKKYDNVKKSLSEEGYLDEN